MSYPKIITGALSMQGGSRPSIPPTAAGGGGGGFDPTTVGVYLDSSKYAADLGTPANEELQGTGDFIPNYGSDINITTYGNLNFSWAEWFTYAGGVLGRLSSANLIPNRSRQNNTSPYDLTTATFAVGFAFAAGWGPGNVALCGDTVTGGNYLFYNRTSGLVTILPDNVSFGSIGSGRDFNWVGDPNTLYTFVAWRQVNESVVSMRWNGLEVPTPASTTRCTRLFGNRWCGADGTTRPKFIGDYLLDNQTEDPRARALEIEAHLVSKHGITLYE